MFKKIYLSVLITLMILSLFAGVTLSWFTDDDVLEGYRFTTAEGGNVTFSVYEKVYGEYLSGIDIDIYNDENYKVGDTITTNRHGETEKGLFSGEYRYEVDEGTDYRFLNEIYSNYEDPSFEMSGEDVGIEVYLEVKDR